MSPTRFRVSKLSIKPIAAKITAYGRMISIVAQFNGTIGICHVGRPPLMEAKSPTRGTSMPKPITTAATIPIPASGAGMNLVMRGITQMIAIVAITRPSII